MKTLILPKKLEYTRAPIRQKILRWMDKKTGKERIWQFYRENPRKNTRFYGISQFVPKGESGVSPNPIRDIFMLMESCADEAELMSHLIRIPDNVLDNWANRLSQISTGGKMSAYHYGIRDSHPFMNRVENPDPPITLIPISGEYEVRTENGRAAVFQNGKESYFEYLESNGIPKPVMFCLHWDFELGNGHSKFKGYVEQMFIAKEKLYIYGNVYQGWDIEPYAAFDFFAIEEFPNPHKPAFNNYRRIKSLIKGKSEHWYQLFQGV